MRANKRPLIARNNSLSAHLLGRHTHKAILKVGLVGSKCKRRMRGKQIDYQKDA